MNPGGQSGPQLMQIGSPQQKLGSDFETLTYIAVRVICNVFNSVFVFNHLQKLIRGPTYFIGAFGPVLF